MKSIRIGNDIRIEWPIVLSGDVSKLQDLDLTVEVRPSAKIIDTHNYADEIRNNDNKRLLFEKHETTVMMNGGLECRRDIGDGKEHCRPRPPRPCPPRPHRPLPPSPVKLPYHIEDNTLIAMWTADRQFATGDYDIILYAHKNEGGQAVCDQYRFVRLVSHTAQADAPDDSGIEAVIAMQPVTLELSGLSAYEVAVINGFQGTEEDWLASLKKPAEDAAEELKQEIEQFKEDTKEELQADIKALGYYEDNPEFIRAYTDAEGKFLWGIRIDGSIEWAKGVPTPIQNALKELADKIKDLGGDKIEEVETALNEKIEALQDAIDVINASLKTLTDTFSYQDNPEFVNVVTDSDGKVLFGIKEDGKPYFPKNETYSVESNQEFLAAWLDSAGHVLFGLRQNGSTYVAKADFLDKIEEIRQLLEDNGIDDDELKQRVEALEDTFSHQENEEFAYVVTDNEGKVLFGIKVDGSPYYPNNEMYRVIQNEEYLAAWVDANNKLLFGIKTDGSTYIAKSEYIDAVKEIQEKLTEIEVITENFEVTDNPEFIATTVDNEGKVLEATQADGKKYFPKQALLDKYDDVEDRSEITLDAEDRILAYRDKDGIRHESKLDVDKIYQNGKEVGELASKEDVRNVTINASDIPIAELDGVQDHSLPNLFDKTRTRAWNSDFADKVFAKIGRKTANTGCYSNNIEAKEGDWFTRSDFGTGIVVALDENEDVLGDVANAAYKPTVQIVPSDPSKYDFSTMKYVVFVVMLENLNSERIVKAKYMPTGEGDYLTIPKLRVMSDNMDKDVTTYIKSNSGRYYQLQIDDSGESPVLTPVALEGIPNSELPSDFPTFKVSGDFSQYYDGLVLCPIEGGVSNYLYELAPNGLVKRYLKKKVNCPRVLKEGGTWYCYGVDGGLNSSSGKLNIYKANGETFELVEGNLGGGEELNMSIEPHDCLVISVSPLHYIYQRYVGNQTTVVDGQPKVVTSLHVGEVYDGQLLSEWHSEDYPELWIDSHVQGDNADYLHNNTICVSSDGNLYLNNKQANQIIVLKRTWDDKAHTATIGNILWKIGGNRTHSGWDVPTRIKTTTEQQWYESHDAVINSNGLITMYDNKASGASRILEFNIDTGNKQLTNFKAHTWQQYRGRYMGSVDKLDEGIYLLSWGSQRNGNAANAGIYDFNNNKILFEIRFDNTGSSAYRVYGIPKGQE
jgi:hypothetical protein